MKHEDNQHQNTDKMLTLATVQSWLDRQPFKKLCCKRKYILQPPVITKLF